MGQTLVLLPAKLLKWALMCWIREQSNTPKEWLDARIAEMQDEMRERVEKFRGLSLGEELEYLNRMHELGVQLTILRHIKVELRQGSLDIEIKTW